MTDISVVPISLDDERLIRDGEAAVEEYGKSASNMRKQILPMARGLVAARRRYPSNQDYGDWLERSPYNKVEKDNRAALIKIGEHEDHITGLIRTTTLVSPQLIWRTYGDAAQALASSYDKKTPSEPTSVPEPPVLPDVEAQIEQTARVEVRFEPEVSTSLTVEPENQYQTKVGTLASAPSSEKASQLNRYPLPATSKLRDLLGAKIADVLLARFKNSRMFIRRLGDHPSPNDRSKLKYLAERCVKPDYPIELFRSEGWSLQLMYPHLPQRLLDMLRVTTLGTLHSHHATLAETERRFVLTPEFGMIDPPMAAFNKANEIFNAIVNAKNGSAIDPSAIHRPVYKGDEGKPPVVICGTQLWPAEESSGYGYDDLRCAFEFAKDILLTFEEPRDAPMTTKSLKLRHLMSWLPGGYNSTGSTIDGLLKALRGVVQAYSSNKSDVMRAPLPSMKKLDET